MLTSVIKGIGGGCLVCTTGQCVSKYLSEMQRWKDKPPGLNLKKNPKSKFPNSVSDEDLLKWSQGASGYSAYKINIVNRNKNIFQQRLYGDILSKNESYPRNGQMDSPSHTTYNSDNKMSKAWFMKYGKPLLVDIIKKYHPACKLVESECVSCKTKTTTNSERASPVEKKTPRERKCSKKVSQICGGLETKFTCTNSQGKLNPACKVEKSESVVRNTKTTKNSESSAVKEIPRKEKRLKKVCQTCDGLETKFICTNSQGKLNQHVRVVCKKCSRCR